MTQVDLAVPSLGSSPTQPAFTVLFAISHEELAVPSLGSCPTQQLSGFHAYLAAKYLAVPSLGSSPTQPFWEPGIDAGSAFLQYPHSGRAQRNPRGAQGPPRPFDLQYPHSGRAQRNPDTELLQAQVQQVLAVPSLGSSPTQHPADTPAYLLRVMTCSTLTRVEPNATVVRQARQSSLSVALQYPHSGRAQRNLSCRPRPISNTFLAVPSLGSSPTQHRLKTTDPSTFVT